MTVTRAFTTDIMTSKASLRDLYVDPSSAWSFVPTNPASNATTQPAVPADPPAAPAYQWSSRPAHNSIYDLSPGLAESSTTDGLELAKAIVAAAVLQYTGKAVGMPWEVATTLLQVQWVPRDAGEAASEDSTQVDEDNDDAVRSAFSIVTPHAHLFGFDPLSHS